MPSQTSSKGRKDLLRGDSPGRWGDGEVAAEKGCMQGGSLPGPISEQAVHNSQEGWNLQAGGESPPIEPFCGLAALQDGELPNAQRSCQEGRLDGLHRTERCFSLSAGPQFPPEAPALHLEEEPFRIPVPPIWAKQCPKDIPKSNASGNGGPKEAGHSLHHLHRRYPHLESGGVRDCAGAHHTSEESGLQDQCGEVTDGPITEDNIPGLYSGLAGHDSSSSHQETQENPAGLQPSPQTENTFSSILGEDDRKDVRSHPGNPPSPTLLSKPSAAQEHGLTGLQIIPGTSGLDNRGHAGTPVVDPGGESLEWTVYSPETSRPDNRVGCLTPWMGSHGRRISHGRPLVPTGEETSHQRVGVDGRSVCNQNIHEGEETSSRQTEDGQHHSRGVCEPHGWHQVPKLSRLCEAAMDLVPCKRNIPFGRTPPRCEQRDCRLSVQVSPIISRVETESISVQGDVPQTRSLQDRPLRNSTECSIGEVHELEARSVCSCSGCSTSLLERSVGVCFPSLLPHRQSV